MPNGPVSVGVIGLGAIAERAHLPNFAAASGCRLVAVSSSRAAAARAVVKRYGIPRFHGDWRDLVASDAVDAVAVCSINDEHAAMTLAALRRGKHVLVEKPIAIRGADAVRMVATARQKKSVLAVHHHLRFAPVVRRVRRLLEDEAIGDVVAFDGTFSHRGPRGWAPHAKWFFDERRVGGGVVMDLGVHAFDLLRHWLDDDVRSVAARLLGAADRRGGSAEHHASCVLSFARGAIGTVTVSWRDATYRNHWHLVGTRGALDVDLTGDGAVVLERDGKTKVVAIEGPGSSAGGQSGRGATTAQQAFIDQIRGRPSSPLAQGSDGERALAVALACYRAADGGRQRHGGAVR